MLGELLGALQEVGLVFNASKTCFATETQPPTSLRLQNGTKMSVLPHDCGHKSLGCFLTTKKIEGPNLDIICKALLGHGSCTSGCCATRTFRWVCA